jgi:cyclopropane fatty-acyl-phospholipid synthase-like methyltransferase
MHKKSHRDLIKAFEDPTRDEWQKPKMVLKVLGDLKGKKLIEIGAGSGYFGKYFIKAGADYLAADVDTVFLDHIRTHLPKAKTALIPYDDPKMNSSEFDLAFTCNTYHHIDNRVEYFKKVLSGLKDNGKLVIDELLRSGFKSIKVENEVLTRQYIVIAHR